MDEDHAPNRGSRQKTIFASHSNNLVEYRNKLYSLTEKWMVHMTKIRVGIVDIDVKYLRFFPGIASIFYFLPGIISTIIIMLNLILQGDVDLLIVNFWFLLSFTILNLLIAIGLFRKNIIAWWSAIIWPIVLLGYGFYWYIYCVNQAQMGNHSRTIELTLMTSAFIMQIGIYYLVGMMIIIPVEVKALFKKSTSDIAD